MEEFCMNGLGQHLNHGAIICLQTLTHPYSKSLFSKIREN